MSNKNPLNDFATFLLPKGLSFSNMTRNALQKPRKLNFSAHISGGCFGLNQEVSIFKIGRDMGNFVNFIFVT